MIYLETTTEKQAYPNEFHRTKTFQLH